LERVTQEGCEVLILGNIQKMSGCGAEPLAGVDLGLSRCVKLDDLQ